VVLINESDKKVEIAYKREEIEDIVKSVMGDRPHTLTFSKSSNKGSYHSYELCTLVHNEDDRTEIFRQLKQNDRLKMVL